MKFDLSQSASLIIIPKGSKVGNNSAAYNKACQTNNVIKIRGALVDANAHKLNKDPVRSVQKTVFFTNVILSLSLILSEEKMESFLDLCVTTLAPSQI